MTEPNLAKIAQAIIDHNSEDETQEEFHPFLMSVAGDLSKDQFKVVMAIRDHDHEQTIAQQNLELRQLHVAEEILSGLPKETTFYEACRIEAAQGHALAKQALDHMDSRPARVFNALFDAAVDVHPGWKRLKKEGQYSKHDQSAPEAHGLVEWFQTTYPHEARALEDAIE
jgi:hypothetical protein